MKSRVYLDHAATTPAWPEAIAAMAEAAGMPGNPASVHHQGQRAHGVLERARTVLAGWTGRAADRIIFTSGGTEALSIAIAGCGLRLVAGATEHAAVLSWGAEMLLPVDGDGLIDFAALDDALREGPALVAVQHANNETGVIQPIADIAAMVRAAGSLLLVDAVQSAGKLPLPDADYVAISAHKTGGPMGAGALIVAPSAPLAGRVGAQERGFRAGTPNLPGLAGWAAAIDAQLAAPPDWAAVTVRRDALAARLVAAGAVLHGARAPRLPNILSLGLPGVAATTQLMALDLAGFAVSAGAACSSGKVGPSHVLAAQGLGPAAAEAIRVSLSPATTEAELTAFADAWEAMAARMRPKAAA
ncbi:cysteine desulfurase family protein [Polymorphobacter sp.]|uniref:cysteine desulfurase family protein n=1 Tax=Polymorphobacter sp. TaxID=1909290 RepID=UPI003F719709